MRLTTRYHFSASHRLQLDSLSPEENRRLFDKCNNPYGHGHDYTLEVTVEGPVAADGQVMKRADLDQFVQNRVVSKLNCKNLNMDVADFSGTNPTTENLAELIRGWLQQDWMFKPKMVKLGIIETPKNRFDWEASR